METRKRRRGVAFGRWAFALSVLCAWSAAMLLVTRADLAWADALAGVLFTVPLCSLGEWLVHGVMYHGHLPGLRFMRNIHHNGHHFALFPTHHYVQHGPYEFMRFRKPLLPFRMADSRWDNFLTMYSQIGLHFVVGVPLILLPAWWLTGSVAFAAASLGALAAISWMLGYVHGVIHTPRARLIERMRWFQWLNHHHYLHHVDIQSNMNFMLPLFDVLLGTQKTTMTPDEAAVHPSFEDAVAGRSTRTHRGERQAA